MSVSRPACLALLVLLAACGDGPSEPPPVTGVRLIATGPDSYIQLPPGVPLTIQVEVYDSSFNLLPTPPRTAFTWESSDAAVATVSRDGVVRVQPGASPGALVTIRVGYENTIGFVEVFAAAPPVALHLDPPGRTLTPGAEFVVTGLAENPQGELEPRHHVGFTLTGGTGVARLSAAGCSNDSCIGAEPHAVTLRTDAPGTATVTANADGKSATADFIVRTVNFTDVMTGGGHSCGTTTGGPLFCWGDGYLRTPVQVAVPAGLGDIRAGTTRTCGLDASGHASCWQNSPDPSPEILSSTVSFSELSLGVGSSCGLDSSGAAWCWGQNAWGQLGNGTKDLSVTPVAVSGGLQFQQVGTSWGDETGHACGLTPAGMAYCWGANYAGQLGNPTVADGCAPYGCSTVPVPAAEGHTFTQIVTGVAHTCGLEAGGTAWCWGSAQMLGAGNPSPLPGGSGPFPVAGGHSFVTLTAGADHTCGLKATGAAYCWGGNPDGRTGQPPVGGPPDYGVVYSPALVTGGRTYTALSAGSAHTCGLANDGLYCWGDNGTGQVGVLSGVSTQQPIRVVGQP
jgi:alpha-tubulin suppressor-like RCC1 family protein